MDTVLQQLSPRVSKAEQIGSPNREREAQHTLPGARQCSVLQPGHMPLCWERGRLAEWEQAAHSPLDLGNDGPKRECRGDLKGSLHGQQSHVPGDKVGTIAKYRPILRRLKKLKLQRVMAMCVLSHVSHI